MESMCQIYNVGPRGGKCTRRASKGVITLAKAYGKYPGDNTKHFSVKVSVCRQHADRLVKGGS